MLINLYTKMYQIEITNKIKHIILTYFSFSVSFEKTSTISLAGLIEDKKRKTEKVHIINSQNKKTEHMSDKTDT